MKRIKGADVRNGDTIRREYAAPTSSLRAVEFVANVAIPGDGDALYLLDRPVKLLWPAGTALWLTRFHYPWAKGDRIVLAEDWFDGTPVAEAAAAYTDPMKVPLDAVTDTKPAVELPDVETLGWLTANHYAPSLGVWMVEEDPTFMCRDGSYRLTDQVTAFTPATAVPTDALDALRNGADCSGPLSCAKDHIRDFLAAVDAANRADR